MSDDVLVILSVLVLGAIPGDWYVFARFVQQAARKPYIAALTGMALLTFGIAVAASLFGILALSTLARLTTGHPLLDPSVAIGILVIGILVVSLPNLYLIQLLQRWSR